MHEPRVVENLRVVAQKQRRLPLAFLGKIKLEVDRIVGRPSFRADELYAVCNIVAAVKVNGAVRVCADLSDANKVIIRALIYMT